MKYLPFVVIAIVLSVGTYLEGINSDRWGRHSSEKLLQFAQRLESVPLQIGDWKGVDDTLSERELEEFEASNCEAFVSRTYTNREGQRVNMYLVAGSARHVTIHTPDWCYVGAGYHKEGDPQQYTLLDAENMEFPPEFLTSNFKKEELHGSHYIRIFWTFAKDQQWRGPRIPKSSFAGENALFKVYLITEIDGNRVLPTVEGNPSLDFSRVLFPTLNELLFTDAPAASDA